MGKIIIFDKDRRYLDAIKAYFDNHEEENNISIITLSNIEDLEKYIKNYNSEDNIAILSEDIMEECENLDIKGKVIILSTGTIDDKYKEYKSIFKYQPANNIYSAILKEKNNIGIDNTGKEEVKVDEESIENVGLKELISRENIFKILIKEESYIVIDTNGNIEENKISDLDNELIEGIDKAEYDMFGYVINKLPLSITKERTIIMIKKPVFKSINKEEEEVLKEYIKDKNNIILFSKENIDLGSIVRYLAKEQPKTNLIGIVSDDEEIYKDIKNKVIISSKNDNLEEIASLLNNMPMEYFIFDNISLSDFTKISNSIRNYIVGINNKNEEEIIENINSHRLNEDRIILVEVDLCSDNTLKINKISEV